MTDAVIRDAPNQFAVIILDESTGERIVLWDRDERLSAAAARDSRRTLLGSARLIHVDDVDQDAAIDGGADRPRRRECR